MIARLVGALTGAVLDLIIRPVRIGAVVFDADRSAKWRDMVEAADRLDRPEVTR